MRSIKSPGWVLSIVLAFALVGCAAPAATPTATTAPPKPAAPAATAAPAAQPTSPAAPAATAAPTKPAAPAPTVAPTKPAAVASPAAAELKKPTGKPEITDLEAHTSKDYQDGAQLVIADKKGYFKDAGLNVKINYYQTASDIPPAMVGGSVKIAHGGWANPMQIASLGYNMRIVAQLADWADTLSLVARPDRNINTVKDLEGKSVAMPNIPITVRTLKDIASAYQIDYSKIKVVGAQPSDALTAFLKGDADTLLLWLPFDERAVTEGKGKRILTGSTDYTGATPKPTPRALYINYGTLFMSKDFIDKNPNTVALYLWALGRAERDLETANSATLDQLAQLSAQDLVGGDLPIAQKAIRANKYSMKITKSWVDLFTKEIDFYFENKIIQQKFDGKSVFDPQFLKMLDPTWSDL